jgi:hypothetical protein
MLMPAKGRLLGRLRTWIFGYFVLEAGKNHFHVLHLETEVIEARLPAGRARVQVQTDVAVTDDYGAPGALSSRTLHAQNVVVKIAFLTRVAGDDRHMAHLCKHDRPSLFGRCVLTYEKNTRIVKRMFLKSVAIMQPYE